MLRFDHIVFGPVSSRRLGESLGINLLPMSGKICDFDCIYCECGWNKDGRTTEKMPSFSQIAEALESRLEKLSEDNKKVDSITFSGHGEPTLHPEFPSIVEKTIALRNKYMPAAKVSVLSNATMLDNEDVVKALKMVDNPILKLDASTDIALKAINRPASKTVTVDNIVRGMKKFNGDFILQTMFLKPSSESVGVPDYEVDKNALDAWMNIVRELRPRQVMVYTLDRPAPDGGLQKMSESAMRHLLQPLMDEQLNIQINGK